MDLSNFHKLNVTDTCSIWNMLSSLTFYGASRNAGCIFSCTEFVVYECLYKRRTVMPSKEEVELRDRFRGELHHHRIEKHKISIQDLQAVELLENRKKLSKGELSSIAFAMQTRQAFLSDDKGAIKLALTELDSKMVQSTSQLFGWLFFDNHLADHQKEQIIRELEAHGRFVRSQYDETYLHALQQKLMGRSHQLNLDHI